MKGFNWQEWFLMVISIKGKMFQQSQDYRDLTSWVNAQDAMTHRIEQDAK